MSSASRNGRISLRPGTQLVLRFAQAAEISKDLTGHSLQDIEKAATAA